MQPKRKSNRRKSNGKRSPSTQELRVRITDSPGRTDGLFGVSAVPSASPGFTRREPRETRGNVSKLTPRDIEALPADALVGVDGAKQAVIALYDIDFDSASAVILAYAKRCK